MLADVVNLNHVLADLALHAHRPLMNLRELQIRIDNADRVGTELRRLPQSIRSRRRRQAREHWAKVSIETAAGAESRVGHGSRVAGSTLVDRRTKQERGDAIRSDAIVTADRGLASLKRVPRKTDGRKDLAEVGIKQVAFNPLQRV